MIRTAKGHAVVEVMIFDREIRATFGKLVEAMAFHNNDKIDIKKARMQFKKITNRVIRDFESIVKLLSSILIILNYSN